MNTVQKFLQQSSPTVLATAVVVIAGALFLFHRSKKETAMDFFMTVVYPFIPPALRFRAKDMNVSKIKDSVKSCLTSVYVFSNLRNISKVLVFLFLCFGARTTGSETIFLCLFGFYLVWTNLGDNSGDGVSAYSVFNQGARLPGTFTAEQFEGQLRSSVTEAGFNPQDFVPGYVVEAVYKWLTSKEMTKKISDQESLKYKIQQSISADLEKVRAMPPATYSRACRALKLPAVPAGGDKKTDYTLAIQFNSQIYVNDETEEILKGYGL